MESKLIIETRKLEDLIPAEYNPRKALQPGEPEFEKIVRSIDEFGYVDPIIINSDNTIIGGHQRYEVLKYLGYTSVQCVVTDFDKTREKALNIALNKISGEWDNDKLAQLLIEIDNSTFDVGKTGFEEDELSDLFSNLEIATEAIDDNFDVDEAIENIKQPITKPGDIWQLGNHRLMCGDSTDINDVRALVDGNEIDLIITDPPYNVNYGDKAEYLGNERGVTRQNNNIANDNMSADNFYKFMLDAYSCMFKVAREGGAIYVFHSECEGVTFRSAFSEAGFKQAQCLIWEKNSFVLGSQDYQWRHEPILYGWKEGAAHYFVNDRKQDTIIPDEIPDFNDMKKADIIDWINNQLKTSQEYSTIVLENRPTKNDLHPTMKPVPLIGKLIKNSSKPKWNIADFFGGSGSTLIAAEELDRNSFIMEFEPINCDVIIQRWESLTGKKAVLLNA